MTITLWADNERGLTNAEMDKNFSELAAGCLAQSFIDNRPIIKPSLNINFTKSVLDPRITFTRASNATCINQNGLLENVAINSPRFDYDPITKECKGLLIEEQRTNLLRYSEQFDNNVWLKNGTTPISVSAKATIAPNGTLTADKIIPAAVTTSSYVYNPTSVTSTSAYTFSVFLKAAELVFAQITLQSAGFGTAQWANINLLTGDVYVTGAICSATNVGNGWWRVSYTASAITTATGGSVIRPAKSLSDGRLIASTGDGNSGIYIWGAQLEAGASPTSYIPTTTAAATRAADVAVMTGTNFSSWYRQDVGTFFVDVSRNELVPSSTFPSCITISDATANNFITLSFINNYVAGFFIGNSGISQVELYPVVLGNLLQRRIAGSYAQNSFATSVNSSAVLEDNSGIVPTTCIRMSIGLNSTGFNFLNGHIRRIVYFPKRINNAELQSITL